MLEHRFDLGVGQVFLAVGFDDGTGAMGPAPEAEMPAQAPVRVERAPGRNEPCWCGSGKKFKTCHGA